MGKTLDSSIPLSYNGDAWEDLAISVVGNDGMVELYAGRAPITGDVGTFAKDDNALSGQGVWNPRSVSAADYDNDGNVDLFVGAMPSTSNPSGAAYLLRNPGGTTPVFENATAQLTQSGGPTTHVWSGAWGDPNGDGWLDLYLCRALDGDGSPAGIDTKGLPDVLLEAVVSPTTRAFQGFRDVTGQALLPATSTETASATWADVDADGDLDLFVGWLGALELAQIPGWSALYLNQGDETFREVAGWTSGPSLEKIGAVSGARFADIDGDGLLDLALSRWAEDAQGGLYVRLSETAEPGRLTRLPGPGLTSSTAASAVAVEDLDADGRADVVTAPAEGAAPAILLAYDAPSGPAHGDAAQALGLPAQAVRGLTVADLNNDGDLDLYLGVPPATGSEPREYLFTSDVATRTDQNSVRVVVLGRKGYAALDGTGARVRVSYTLPGSGLRHQVRHVDSGGGRGAQSASGLTVGIGEATQADVEVTWPDGTVLSLPAVPAGPTPVVAQYPVPGPANVVQTSVAATHVPSTGYTSWTFTWETTGPSIYDEVILVTDAYGGTRYTGPCEHFTSNTALNPADPAVRSASRRLPGGNYRHELVWSGPLCAAPCSYTYRVRSWSELTAGTQTQHTSSDKTLSISICSDLQQ